MDTSDTIDHSIIAAAVSTPTIAIANTGDRINSLRQLFTQRKAVIIDMQCVCVEKKYYIKELSILEPNSFAPSVFLFKPPYNKTTVSRQEQYVTRNVNGLCWDYGDIEFTKIGGIIAAYAQAYSTIVLKGRIKREIIESYLTDRLRVETEIIDLDGDMPAFSKLPFFTTNCPVHGKNSGKRCAALYTLLLRYFICSF